MSVIIRIEENSQMRIVKKGHDFAPLPGFEPDFYVSRLFTTVLFIEGAM